MNELEQAIETLRQETAKLNRLRGEMELAEDAYSDQKRAAQKAEKTLEGLIRKAVGTAYTSPLDAPRL